MKARKVKKSAGKNIRRMHPEEKAKWMKSRNNDGDEEVTEIAVDSSTMSNISNDAIRTNRSFTKNSLSHPEMRLLEKAPQKSHRQRRNII